MYWLLVIVQLNLQSVSAPDFRVWPHYDSLRDGHTHKHFHTLILIYTHMEENQITDSFVVVDFYFQWSKQKKKKQKMGKQLVSQFSFSITISNNSLHFLTGWFNVLYVSCSSAAYLHRRWQMRFGARTHYWGKTKRTLKKKKLYKYYNNFSFLIKQR